MKLAHNIQLLSWFTFLTYFRFYYAIAILYFVFVTNSYALAISIFSITQITQALFEIPAGIFSDVFGRKRTLVSGAVATVIGVVLFAIGQSYIYLVVGAIFEGVSRALFSGNNDAFLYETVENIDQKQNYHQILGNVKSMAEAAFLIGGVCSTVLVLWSYSVLMWLSVIPPIVGLIVSLFLVEPPINREKIDSISSHLKDAMSLLRHNKKLRRLSIAGVIGYGIGESSFQFTGVFYNMFLPVWGVSALISVNFFISIVSYRVSGRILKKFKEIHVLVYNEIYSRILNIFALLFPSILSPVLMTVASIGFGVSEVAKNALLQEEFTDKQRATVASITSVLGNIFYGLIAILIGVFADKIGTAHTLLLAQICLFPVLFLYWQVFHTDKKVIADR